tara:strand:- start:34751 stop:35032 length:282 start_codon:yes stop_codon:yes gene_type:complete
MTTIAHHKQLASARLKPIAAWAQRNHGSIVKLCNRMLSLGNEADGVNRHMVGRWLKEGDDAVQPTYGYGLLLEQAYESLVAEEAEAPAEKATA